MPRSGAWAGELTAWQSVGTGEQSRAGSLGEHYHLLQDTPRNIRGSVLPIRYLGWYSGYLEYIRYLSWLVSL